VIIEHLRDVSKRLRIDLQLPRRLARPSSNRQLQGKLKDWLPALFRSVGGRVSRDLAIGSEK
jgi:hypothetical protein